MTYHELEPERIGPYRVVQLLGKGGMGTVYEAEESGLVRRRVAVKVVRAGQVSRDVVERFRAARQASSRAGQSARGVATVFGAEREALALMTPPGLAKVLHAGEPESGDPSFTME